MGEPFVGMDCAGQMSMVAIVMRVEHGGGGEAGVGAGIDGQGGMALS
jgi:hypothetical protein